MFGRHSHLSTNLGRFAVIGTLLLAAACSDDDGSDTATTSGRTDVSVTLRPILGCTDDGSVSATAPSGDPDDPAGMVVLASTEGNFCQLGPTGATGSVFAGDAAAQDQLATWVVNVSIREGAKGNDLVNVVASACYNQSKACPTGKMALVIDGTIVMNAYVMTPEFTGSLQISADYDQTQAQAVADALNAAS